jgi:outer membrane receptor protein involved in Fe transport
VEAGVRYDYEQIPPQFQQDKDNFSPRIGLAYTPASGWVLRTGFGIFFDRYVLANLNRGLELDGRQAFQQVANAALATSLFQGAQGGSLMAPTTFLLPSIYRADPHLATSYSEQASFGIEHQIASHTTADLNYQFVRGVKLSRTRNVNLVPQSVGSPSFGAARWEPQWNDVYQLENSASSTYHGLTASLHRQLANEIEFSANYTWSKAIDDASDFEEQPQDPYHLRAERALSRYHQEHRFVASGLFDLPWGDEDDPHPDLLMSKLLSHIELAPILTASSAHPVNPLISTDANGSQAFPLAVRPAGFGRNTLWVPGNITLDFRMVKYFPVGEHGRLDLVVDAFNLLNRTNITQINPWFGTGRQALPTFAHPVEAASARQFQFSLDFEF